MPGRVPLLRTLLLLATFATASYAQETVRLPRVAIDGSGDAARLLEESAAGSSVAVRIALDSPVVDADLERRLKTFEARRVPIWLTVPVLANEGDIERWRLAVRTLAERGGSTLRLVELVVDGAPGKLATFAVQAAATELRGRRDDVRVGLGGSSMGVPASRAALYTAALTPYVDLVVLPAAASQAEIDSVRALDSAARVALAPPSGPVIASIAATAVQDLGTDVAIRAWPSAGVSVDAIRALAPLGDLLTHDVTVLEPASVDLSLRVGTRDASATVAHRLLFDTDTFATLLVYRGERSAEPLTVSLRMPIEGTPAVLDVATGERAAPSGYTRDAATLIAQAAVPLTGSTFLVNFNEGAGVIAERSGVNAERTLSVAEIISRHQRQQAMQDGLVRTYIAEARTRQFFRPTITDPGYDLVTLNRYFVAADGIEWEERDFSVNNRTFKERPPVPLLQPEQIFSLPLQLRFDEGYTYRLVGLASVDGVECYEVRFEPVRKDPSLYSGTVWIDRRTFARLRVQARQSGLPGMVLSNDETLRYSPVATVGNQPIYLLSSVRGHQLVLISGTNIPIDKEVTFTGFRINAEAFEGERAAARASESTMFRETPRGLRYYVKRDGVRVVSERPTDSVKAMALGTVIDPSYQFPLPIFGINYIDFAFRNPDTQLAMLFAGVLAAGNIQRPHLGGSARLDASLDFFAIAAPSSDRVYTDAGEREGERVLTWPMSTGLNLGWQATTYQKLTFGYEFRFDAYVRDRTTLESYRPPSSTVTNGVGLGWEYSRAGYNVVLNGTWYARARWREWGDASQPISTPRSYAKFTASVSRDIFLNAFQKINVNGAWFGGRDLDRFVKYQFGLFDSTRIHGVPAAVRFSELAMARGSYSVNVFDQYRLDLFADHAWGQDDDGSDWQRVPGIGAAFNLPGPWNTIVRADVGRSWLPSRYGSLGSTVLQIMVLKPLR